MAGWQNDEVLLSCTTEIERLFLDAADFRTYWFPPSGFLPFCRVGYRIRVRCEEYGVLLNCDIDDVDRADFRRDATQVFAADAINTIKAIMNGGVRT